MNVNYPSILMIASSVISLFLSLYAWKHRDEHAVFPLFWLLAVTTIWSFCYGVEVSSTDLTQMKILNSFGYIGITMIPVLWLIFAARYCGKDHWLTSFNTILLFIIPILTIIMVATNDLHHLFYSTDELRLLGIYYFQKLVYGPYWLIHVCYSYLALVWGLGLFIRRFFQIPRAQRGHIRIFVAGALLPFFVNLTYLAGLKPFGFLDLTPIAFIFSGSLFLLGIFTIDLFKVTPLALDMLFNNIPEAIIVLDAKNRVINTNPLGKALLQSGAFQKTINDLKPTGSFITNDFLSAQYSERELKIEE
jgi:PAS domain-containing protein